MPAGSTKSVTLNLTPKSIDDGFDPRYGTLYTPLGVALPTTLCTYTASTGVSDACPIPYNQWDPTTEVIKNSNATALIGTLDDGTQIWRIFSNSVDTHPMHWHLFKVQVINRIGQLNGQIKPPDPNELGWRETLRVNPLEDTIVALRPIKPTLPWGLPNNIRPLDVTAPIGSTGQFQNIDPTDQVANVTNHLVNFGEEYVWHCHILGHEEAAIMRPMSIVVMPNSPVKLNAIVATIKPSSPILKLSWIDNSTDETNWTIRRATSASGPWTTIAVVASTTGSTTSATVAFSDTTVARKTTYYYQLIATNIVGDTTSYASPAVGYPNVYSNSTPSNTALATTS